MNGENIGERVKWVKSKGEFIGRMEDKHGK
jgi:hypothetical protein